MFGGIYIHVPFCVSKCPYCDFFSTTDTSLVPAFLDALSTEMQLTRNEDLTIDTLFIGGGTPSVLDVAAIGRIIEDAHRNYPLDAAVEITMEVNPGTVSLDQLKGYRRGGVNRINIGIQSFDSKNLDFLKRSHCVSDNHQTIGWVIEAGFETIGFDLMYGIPGQTKRSWLADLQQAVAAEPHHLSCYMLTFERGTPLDHDRRVGRFEPLSDENICELYAAMQKYLAGKGYFQYEISNFANGRSGAHRTLNPDHNQSRHNLKYWSFAPYFGLGPSAHSYIEPQRFWNHSSVKKYIADLSSGRLPIEGRETLNQEQMMLEAIYLGLRQTKGIAIDVFNSRFGLSFYDLYRDTVKGLEQKGLMQCSRNHCALTPKGMLLLDSIAALFV
jgi:oxygen-independent coproporphyrinogen III oxidase